MKALAILAFFTAVILGYFYYELDKDASNFAHKIKPQQLDYQAYTPEEKSK